MLPHEDVGTGPAVVLLHAGIADRRMWAELLPAVAEAGYRAIAVDLPGFGDAPPGAGAPHAAVLETLDGLEIERAAMIGVSFGGYVALGVAVTAPSRIERLMVVSAPAPDLDPSAELRAAWEAEEAALERDDVEAAVRAVVDAWTLPGSPRELRDAVARMQRRAFELQTAGDDDAPDDDPLERDPAALGALDVPALVAHGELDMPDFAACAERLAQQLRAGPPVVIAGARHLAPLEQPGAFRTLALEFLGGARVTP